MSNTPTPTSIAAWSECAVVTALKKSLSPEEWERIEKNITNEIENDRSQAPSALLIALQRGAIDYLNS